MEPEAGPRRRPGHLLSPRASESAYLGAAKRQEGAESASVAVPDAAAPPAGVAGLAEAVAFYRERSVADSTRRGWQAGWAGFASWCQKAGARPLPADAAAVCAYLAWMARLADADGAPVFAAGTIGRHLAAVDRAHTAAGYPAPGQDPGVRAVLHGIRRTRADTLTRRKTPLLLRDLRRLLATLDTTSFPAGVIGRRDRAILLAGFAGAWRRGELAALRAGDLTLDPGGQGLHARVRRSKMDQEGTGQVKALPYGRHAGTCAPCALASWLRLLHAQQAGGRVAVMAELARPLPEGGHLPHDGTDLALLEAEAPVFRPVRRNGTIGPRGMTGSVVSDMLRRRAETAGLPGDWGGHSLRAGFITQALQEHATFHEVMRQTGHADPATVQLYARENTPLDGNAIIRIRL